jgi:hypothetical protein
MDDDSEPVGPEVALLSRSSSDLAEQTARREPNMTRAGTLRAYYLGCVVCMGGFLFGYDSGIIGMTDSVLFFDTC